MSSTSHMSPMPRRPIHHVSLSGQAVPSVESQGQGLAILQLNIEGLTTAKLTILEQIVTSNKATVVLIQETHQVSNSIMKLPGFTLADFTKNKHHGLATLVKSDATWTAVSQSADDAEVEWIAINVQDTTIVNVYKPPPCRLVQGYLPDVPTPALYAGDFNSRHTDCGYTNTNEDGAFLVEWASVVDATLLYDPKEPSTFYSARWNCNTNPDLAFSKHSPQEAMSVRRILDRFPRSHHRPSLITTSSLIHTIGGRPVLRWHFRKAKWDDFENAVNALAENLPLPTRINLDDAYSAYCRVLLTAAGKHIPRGRRPAYVPCWDAECEALLQTHIETQSEDERDTAATNLHRRLDEKRRERWAETVASIDFTHSSKRAWQTLNRLTGRTSKPSICPITADAIASQLTNNGRFPDADKTFSRQTTSKVRDLCRAPSADSDLSIDFTLVEMTSAMRKLKSGKSPGPDNIHPEFILHQGPKLLEWLRVFCSVCLHWSKLPKIWRRAKVIALPKPNKHPDDPKGYRPISLLCVPYKVMERLLYARLDPVIDPQLPKEQAGFRRGKSTTDQVTLLTQDIEDTFQVG